MCFSEISADFGFLKFDYPGEDGTNDRLSQVNCLVFMLVFIESETKSTLNSSLKKTLILSKLFTEL